VVLAGLVDLTAKGAIASFYLRNCSEPVLERGSLSLPPAPNWPAPYPGWTAADAKVGTAPAWQGPAADPRFVGSAVRPARRRHDPLGLPRGSFSVESMPVPASASSGTTYAIAIRGRALSGDLRLGEEFEMAEGPVASWTGSSEDQRSIRLRIAEIRIADHLAAGLSVGELAELVLVGDGTRIVTRGMILHSAHPQRFEQATPDVDPGNR